MEAPAATMEEPTCCASLTPGRATSGLHGTATRSVHIPSRRHRSPRPSRPCHKCSCHATAASRPRPPGAHSIFADSALARVPQRPSRPPQCFGDPRTLSAFEFGSLLSAAPPHVNHRQEEIGCTEGRHEEWIDLDRNVEAALVSISRTKVWGREAHSVID